MNMFNRITQIFENYIIEEDEQNGIIKIYYSDLDLEGREKVLKAIEAANEGLKVFTDDTIREQVEEKLADKPLVILEGEDVINNFDLLNI